MEQLIKDSRFDTRQPRCPECLLFLFHHGTISLHHGRYGMEFESAICAVAWPSCRSHVVSALLHLANKVQGYDRVRGIGIGFVNLSLSLSLSLFQRSPFRTSLSSTEPLKPFYAPAALSTSLAKKGKNPIMVISTDCCHILMRLSIASSC